MDFNFKDIHIGELISKKILEINIDSTRIYNYFQLDDFKIKEILSHKSIDTEILLKWSKLLGYDFFRVYSHNLILYSPPSIKKNENVSSPQFRKNIYSKEIIMFILELIEKGEKSKAEIIQEYRIPKTTLYKWIQKYKSL